jgi:hypothetical protein
MRDYKSTYKNYQIQKKQMFMNVERQRANALMRIKYKDAIRNNVTQQVSKFLKEQDERERIAKIAREKKEKERLERENGRIF